MNMETAKRNESGKTQSSLRAMGSLVRENRWPMTLSMISTVVMVVVGYITPLLLGEVIDCVLAGKPTTLSPGIAGMLRGIGWNRTFFQHSLWVLGMVVVALNLISGAFSYLRGRMNAVASERIARKLRESLYDHIQKLPFGSPVLGRSGDLLQRCTSDIETIRRFLAVQVMEVVNAVLMVGIALVIMLGRHVLLTVISLVLVPVLFCFAMWYFRRVHTSFRDADEAEARMTAVLQENLTGVRVVRAFGQEMREVEKFDEVSRDYRNKSVKLNDYLAIYWGGGDAISMTQSMITLLVCILFAVRGSITVGTLVVFTSYVGQLLFPVRQMGRTLSDTGKSLIAMERILEIMNAPAEPEEPDALRPPLDRDIVFDHVSFMYPDGDTEVLRDLNLTIKAGETIAVLGGTGSGKSTMMYLLQRLYEPTGGEIRIGDVPLNRIDRTYLRSHVGLNLQEPFLYSRTIRENVGIARKDAAQREIDHAVRVAAADTFIREAEKGYDTIVGERGVTLSGGQKQRIAIARVLMKENQILIFDDSLSALDTETDAKVRQALEEEQQGVTTLIISHRITTLAKADRILVLEDGRITQLGTHEELMQEEGLYRQIAMLQQKTGEEEEGD